MSDPLEPNFTPGAGRLATDRFDFQKHVDGYSFKHQANGITLFPTVVIGTTKTNVQDAIEALALAISPPTIPDATNSVKGILKLTGDLGGTAAIPVVTGLRGYPISSIPPTTNYVLTWNGSTWTPLANTSSFTAGGDLGGSNSFQQVISLTGSSNIITVNSDIMSYLQSTSPLLTQYNNTSTDGENFTIRAQSSNITNQSGGSVILAGGRNGTGSGLRGGVKLQFTTGIASTYPVSLSGLTSANMLEIAEVGANRKVISLCRSSDISSTQVPSGDMLIFVGEVSVAPGSAPAGGFEMYSSSGNPYFYTSGGTKLGITGTSGSANNGGTAIPTAAGFLIVNINGTTYKIPYCAN